MKITKKQLRLIIREEKQKLLREYREVEMDAKLEETLWSALDEYVMVMDEEMGYDVPRDQLKANVYEFVDDYFKQSEYAAEDAKAEEKAPDHWIDDGGVYRGG